MRVHDIGGNDGFGALNLSDEETAVTHEWEARVFILNRLLMERGIYNLDEFRYTIERLDPQIYANSSYFERWLLAIERLLHEKGVLHA